MGIDGGSGLGRHDDDKRNGNSNDKAGVQNTDAGSQLFSLTRCEDSYPLRTDWGDRALAAGLWTTLAMTMDAA